MNRNNKKAKMAALAILPALGIAAFAGSVFAANSTTIPTPARSFMGMMGQRFHDNTTFASNLATVLGLTATDVKAKLDAGQTPSAIITAAGKAPVDVMAQLQAVGEANRKAKLAAAVASGKITQAQADTMLANGFGFGRGGHDGGLADKTTFANNLASVLGLTATDVKSKLDAGQRPIDIITAAGKTPADVQAKLQALQLTSLKTALAADVASGKITQAEADAMLARHEANKGNGNGHRGGGPFRGMMGSTNTTR